MILLAPGPCMTSETVRQAAAMPDMSHRDPAFLDILRETKERLLCVYPQLPGKGQVWKPYLIGGSGTAAVEAMIASCVRKGPVLLIDSGYYSGRVRAKLEAHEIPYEVLATETWQDRIDLGQLYNRIEAHPVRGPAFEAVITTHHETTAGRLHDLAEIGSICSESDTKLLVDAMSSFGADEIDFTHVDAAASSSNKCLHGLPGLSFVLVRDWLAEEMKSYSPRTVYLSLPFYEGDAPPLTPPVPILNALRQALIEMGPGGATSREAVYRRRAAILRQGLISRGFSFAIPEESMSCTLTTASIPSRWTADRWFSANLGAGFMIYPTKGSLSERWFQVANMGELTDDHLHGWLEAVDTILSSNEGTR